MKYIKDLVSVVIPTHNRVQLLERAVKSAVNQTYKQLEVIVVSDGSDDGTDELMGKLISQFGNLKYINYKPGKGGNYARNTGIKSSSGEWVAFLDDDDEWHLDKIERQIELAQGGNYKIVCCAINSIDDATGKTSIFIPPALEDSSLEILKRNCIGSTTTVMVDHELLDYCGMFDEELKAMQDYDLWIRLCQRGSVGIVTEPMVEYHNLAGNNQVSWNYQKYAEAANYITKKYEMLFEEKLSKGEIKEIRANGQLSVARKAMKANNRKMVRYYAKEALKIKISFKAIVTFFASFFPIAIVRTIYKRK